MILDEIQLEGFLSYKTNQTINFKDVVTILVSGKKGSGKSSLFEAFATCLYGRKASRGKTLDELINEDCTYAYIRTDITFNNVQYRRIRQWGKKKQNSLLQYQNGKYVEIAKDNEADTKNDEIFGSWDLFCTIYLKQKGLINFIEGDSSTRKALLRELLNLDVYQKASDASLKKVNEITSKLKIKQNEVDSFDEILLDEEKHQNSLEKYHIQLEELKKIQQDIKKHIVKKQKELQEEQIKQSKAEDIKKNIVKIKTQKVELENELEKIDDKINDRNSDIVKLKKLIKQLASDDIEEEIALVEKKLLSLKKYQDMKLHVIDKTSLVQLVKTVSTLNLNIGSFTTSIKETKKSINKIDSEELIEENERLKKELKVLLPYEKKKLHIIDKTIIDGFLDEVSKLSMHIGVNTSLVDEIEKKILKFKGCEGLCPILEEPCKLVSIKNNQEYLDSLVDDLNQKKMSLKLFQESLESFEKNIIETKNDFKQKEIENTETLEAQSTIQSYQKQLIENQKTINDNNKELKKLTSEIEDITLKLENEKDVLKKTEEKISEIEEEIEEKDLENTKTIEAKKNIQLYTQSLDNLKLRLVEYQEQIKNHNEHMVKYESLQTSDEKEKVKIVGKIKTIDIELQELLQQRFNSEVLIELQDNVEILNNEDHKNQKTQNTILELLGEVKAKIQNFEDIKKKKHEIEKEIVKIKYDIVVYEKLVFVFGKNGIQKSIMKSAVPELERLATQLIQKFCPTQDIKICFDLDPQKKDGELKAQGGLDIVIKENGKSRGLNLYSGGETTEITFSIYLSLAELSSCRAGRRMQTLIIDERVSGLDEEGIIRFSEIIEVIEKRYNRCIIITHITQLKDLFDSQILVEKTNEGSVIKKIGG